MKRYRVLHLVFGVGVLRISSGRTIDRCIVPSCTLFGFAGSRLLALLTCSIASRKWVG